jgi:hypothetical protein
MAGGLPVDGGDRGATGWCCEHQVVEAVVAMGHGVRTLATVNPVTDQWPEALQRIERLGGQVLRVGAEETGHEDLPVLD